VVNRRLIIVALCALFIFGVGALLTTGCGEATGGTGGAGGAGGGGGGGGGGGSSGGSGGQTGAFVLDIPSGGDQITTGFVVPGTLDPAPLLVWLHGDTGGDSSESKAFRKRATDAGWIAVRPVAPNSKKSWWRYGNQDGAVMAVVAHVKANYNVDLSRIYLAGFSGGAQSTSTVGHAHGETFAACGMHCGCVALYGASQRKAPFFVYCGKQCFLYQQYGSGVPQLEAAGHEVDYMLGEGGHTPYRPAYDANWEFFQTHKK
jgi:poly(3-hydroxybutyrate) depolymerase